MISCRLTQRQKINIHHNDGLDILDNLFYDKTRYVTRSVANHLNDISKIDAEKVIETLQALSSALRHTMPKLVLQNLLLTESKPSHFVTW